MTTASGCPHAAAACGDFQEADWLFALVPSCSSKVLDAASVVRVVFCFEGCVTAVGCADTGGDCWKGAVAMARFFQEEAATAIQGRRVLELASGTGVLGLSLGAMGAKSVTMTDKACMVPLLESNIRDNWDLVAADNESGRSVVQCGSLDWLEATADPVVLEAAPFDCIVMSDVIYEEEIVVPLVDTLRRLCHFDLVKQKEQKPNLSVDLRPPRLYLCASHRAERIEDMFFTTASPWFLCRELTPTLNPVLKRILNKDAIAIWVLEARADLLLHLVDGIGELVVRGDGLKDEMVQADSDAMDGGEAEPSVFRSETFRKVSIVAKMMRPSADGVEKCSMDVQEDVRNVHRRVRCGQGEEGANEHPRSRPSTGGGLAEQAYLPPLPDTGGARKQSSSTTREIEHSELRFGGRNRPAPEPAGIASGIAFLQGHDDGSDAPTQCLSMAGQSSSDTQFGSDSRAVLRSQPAIDLEDLD
jgi:hypothetical protein